MFKNATLEEKVQILKVKANLKSNAEMKQICNSLGFKSVVLKKAEAERDVKNVRKQFALKLANKYNV